MAKNRGFIDTVLPNMFSNQAYSSNYLFYAHMIGQCSIVMDENLPAAAGVAFMIDHYNLYINPKEFDQFTLEEALGVLKHEMLHILNNHVLRAEDRVHLPWNYSTDCAINQLIERKHLPDYAIYPDNFPVKVDEKQAAEYYYDMLKDEAQKQQEDQTCPKCGGTGEIDKDQQRGKGKSDEDGQGQDSQDGEGQGQEGHEHGEDSGKCTCDRCGGTGREPGTGEYKQGTGKLIDDHGTWEESQGDGDLQKDLTKQMIDKAINETVKSRGNLPSNIEHYVSLFTRKSQVSWKRVLRNIVANKKVNTRRTIMRADRRFPKREDLRGKTKDRLFDLTVIVDISGSMSDLEIMTGLNEIHNICKMTKTSMKLIQVDTVVHKVEEFSEKTKIFERTGCGGTIMEPAIDYIREHKIPTDACILITDGYIEDVSQWKVPPKYKMMFLTTQSDIPGVNNVARYQQFKLNANLQGDS